MDQEWLDGIMIQMLSAQDSATHYNEAGPEYTDKLRSEQRTRDSLRSMLKQTYIALCHDRDKALAERDRLEAENVNLRGKLMQRRYQHPVVNLTFDPPLVFDGTRERCELNNRLARMQAERDSESRWAAEYLARAEKAEGELAKVKAATPPDAAGLLRALAGLAGAKGRYLSADVVAAYAWADRLEAK